MLSSKIAWFKGWYVKDKYFNLQSYILLYDTIPIITYKHHIIMGSKKSYGNIQNHFSSKDLINLMQYKCKI
jgi:hypothetical protein